MNIKKMDGIEISFRITFPGGRVDSDRIPIVEFNKMNHAHELLEDSIVGTIIYLDGPKISFERGEKLLNESFERLMAVVQVVELVSRGVIYQKRKLGIDVSKIMPETIKGIHQYKNGKFQN